MCENRVDGRMTSQQLYEHFQQQLLEGMHINREKPTQWVKSDKEYLIFDFVCRHGGNVRCTS